MCNVVSLMVFCLSPGVVLELILVDSKSSTIERDNEKPFPLGRKISL